MVTGNPISRRTFIAGSMTAGIAAGVTRGAGTAAAPRGRPRLYFTAADLPKLRERFEGLEALRKARSQLIADADAALEREFTKEEYAVAGRSQHGNYYTAARVAGGAIETCGFAHLLTGEKRYANRAREALRHFAGYKQWTGRQFATRDPAWHSALETAHFTRAYALGIDWLGDALNDDERREACDALARLGVEPIVRDWLEPRRRIHALDSMGHNWWMVCVSAAGLGAMTLLGEDERAAEWLRMVVEGVPEFFAYPGNVLQNKIRSFDPEGGFYESLNYAHYTLLYWAYVTAALQHMFPKGLEGRRFDAPPPQLDGMFEFIHYFLYPRRGEGSATDPDKDYFTVGFGDDGRHTLFSGDVTLFLARAAGDGRYRWYFDRYSGGPSGFYQMILYDPAALPKARSPRDLPPARALHTMGWASLRDSWEDDATMLAIKCGDTWNHAHADAGSFVLFAGGEPLLIDPGSCSYGRREYRSYYTESIAHNTVLLDGRGQPRSDGYRGTKFPGRLYSFFDAPEARYVLADATGPFAHLYGRFLRHFLWLDDTIVLVDDLLAHEKGRFEWLFHGETTPTFRNGRLEVAVGAARLEMDVLFPKELEAEERKGLAVKNPDRALNYLVLSEESGRDNTKFIALLRAGRRLPQIEIARLGGPEWIGARWKGPAARWDLYCNLRADGRRMHNNSNLRMDRWDTDAFLLGVRSGDARRLVLVGGSYLRTGDGEVLFDCLSKCNAVVTSSNDGRNVSEVCIQAPTGSRVRVGSGVRPERAIMNGKPIPAGSMQVRNGMVLLG